jgi:hypothetical protein
MNVSAVDPGGPLDQNRLAPRCLLLAVTQNAAFEFGQFRNGRHLHRQALIGKKSAMRGQGLLTVTCPLRRTQHLFEVSPNAPKYRFEAAPYLRKFI